MDLHYQREIAVGTLVLVGLGLFVAGTMWLKGESFNPRERQAVAQFSDIGTLQIDNPVVVSGVSLGKVRNIEFRGPGRVLVTVSLDPSLELRSDAQASVKGGFFSSDTRLVLYPGSDNAPPLAPDGVIQGTVDPGIFGKGAALADRADSVLIGVQALANQRTANELTQTLRALRDLLATMNRQLPATGTEAERTLAALRRLADRLDSTLADVPVASAIARADTLAANLSTMSIQLTATGAQLDTLLQRVNEGEGTLGKLASDSGLYLDARAASQSLKALLDELTKHPGKITVQIKLF